MLNIYRRIFDLLDATERRRYFILIAILVVVALSEMAGLGIVFALLAILADPSMIESNRRLAAIYSFFGFTSTSAFQTAFAAVAIVTVIVTQGIKMLGVYAGSRFANMRVYTISSRLLSLYLRQPYTWFLSRNSSDISRRVLSEVESFRARALMPSIELVSAGLLAVAIIGFLLAVDPLICAATALVIGGGYVGIYFWQRRHLREIGAEIIHHNQARYQLTNEAIGGFKEVKLMGLERGYTSRFEKAALEGARRQAVAAVLFQVPRYALEALVFGFLIALVMVMLLRNNGDLVAILPKLGIFAFATMRLFPAIQMIYAAVSNITVGQAVVDQLHDDYTRASRSAIDLPSAGSVVLRPEREITLERVSFAYPATDRTALTDVSMSIPRCATIGIVGGTGAGKTTLVDLILGLLEPDGGTIRIDDTGLTNDTLRSWQRTIGYVPQTIYLTDDTVRNNIAFGVRPDAIDDGAVERAARLAALHDFVMTELPDGYDTLVGERGVRLSGGQRQRIGIARALYHTPSVLILDEATSALDNITERVVMEAVETMRDEMTIIMIAHRLSTVRQCDIIYVMERGRIAASGPYDTLLRENQLFQRMAVGT